MSVILSMQINISKVATNVEVTQIKPDNDALMMGFFFITKVSK